MSRYLRPVWEDRLLSVLRIMTGLLFMQHGTAKVLDFPHRATHAPRGFFPLLNGGELAIVYCFVFLFFSAAGGGVWSLDRSRGAEDPD